MQMKVEMGMMGEGHESLARRRIVEGLRTRSKSNRRGSEGAYRALPYFEELVRL